VVKRPGESVGVVRSTPPPPRQTSRHRRADRKQGKPRWKNTSPRIRPQLGAGRGRMERIGPPRTRLSTQTPPVGDGFGWQRGANSRSHESGQKVEPGERAAPGRRTPLAFLRDGVGAGLASSTTLQSIRHPDPCGAVAVRNRLIPFGRARGGSFTVARRARAPAGNQNSTRARLERSRINNARCRFQDGCSGVVRAPDPGPATTRQDFSHAIRPRCHCRGGPFRPPCLIENRGAGEALGTHVPRAGEQGYGTGRAPCRNAFMRSQKQSQMQP